MGDPEGSAKTVGIKFKPGTQIGPIEEARSYVNHEWVEQLIPARTTCYRCKVKSPVVHVPYGTIAFGDIDLLKRGSYKDRDITREAVLAFGDLGWKFQAFRSYCPNCKNLGRI